MYCESCLLKGKSSLFPSGAFNPDYYILGDVATQAELEANQVFSITTPAGQYLNNVCQSIGMTQDNTRLFKIVRCAPDYYSNSEDLPARENCHHYAFMDIFKTSPKIIITLGREASKVLLGDRATAISTIRGRIYEVLIEGQIYRVMPTFSPNFIVNNPSQSEQFVNDLLHAMSYVKGDLIDIGQKELLYAKNYEEFYNYYEDKLKDKLIISFDLETNARDSRSQDARMVGFSMAPDGSSGIYVVRESLEYKMPAKDWTKITELAKSILSEKTALIHNTMYEVPFTYNEWSFYIENFIDTLIKARLLLGGKIGAGLKDRCILDLGYPDWDHDLDEYRAGFTTLLSKLKPTSSGSARWDFTHMKNRGLASLYDEYASEIENGRELDKRCNACYDAINKIRNVILKYYTSDTDYSIIIELISDELVALIDVDYSGPFSYGFIPLRIITKYGAMDSVATQDLNIYLDKKLEEYSAQLGINLKNGYEYMRRHYVAGTWMEMNGLYWNDEVANQEKKWYEDQCFKTSLAMIDSPFLDNMLFNEQQWMLNDYIVENHLDLVRQILGNFYIMKSGIKLESTGELIRYKRLLERLGPSFANQYRSVLLNLVRQKARTHNHYTELKYIFNPASPKQSMKDTLNSIFITPEIQIAHFMNKLNVMLDDGDFNIEKYPPSDRPLFRVLLDCRNYNKYIDDYNNLDESAEDTEILARIESMEEKLDIIDDGQEVEEDTRKRVKLTKGDTFKRFAATLAETRIQSRELTRSASESMNYHLDSISENNIIEINNYYCITGVDVDDQSTWTDRYKFLVNFRIWKKCNKMITTYINGAKVGRGSVWIVDKNSLESGDTLTRRKRLYDGNVHEDETCLMQPTYKVCTASSFRWQAGMHCLHPDTEIILTDGRNIKVSELHEEFRSDKKNYVYSLQKQSDGIGYRFIVDSIKDVYISYYANNMVRVHLDNGKYFEVTPDHKMIRRNGEYVEAQDLVEGDSLYPINFNEDDRGYKMIYNPDYNEEVYCHYLAFDYNLANNLNRDMSSDRMGNEGSWVRHHEDFNKMNNNPDNVNCYGYVTHTEIHAHSSEGHKAQWETQRKRMANDPNYAIKRLEDFKRNGRTSLDKMWQDEGFRKMQSEKCSNENITRNKDPKGIANRTRGRILSYLNNLLQYGDLTAENFEQFRFEYRKENPYFNFGMNSILKNFDSFEEAVSQAKLYNHKVVRVEKIYYEEAIPVYSIAINPNNPSFPLSCGVMSKNTIPAESSIKNIYTSRYEGGCIAAPDFSQMELRTMSGASKCKALIEAFRSGADIHLQNAVKIFKKPAEEITAAERRYAKMASFMILYGGDYRSFGAEFLDGDVKLAKSIYDSFYEAYPEVAEYIEEKHREMKEHGKVTTLMDMFINISPDDDTCRGDEGKALRLAQNAPIQSASSMIAGCCLYEIMKFIRQNNFKSKIILFVHDSIEIDIHPAEMLQLASQIIPMMNKFPNEQFNMPVKADLVLGKSIGQEVTIEEIKCNEDFTEGEMICEADEDNFNSLISEWRKVYKSVTWEDISEPKTKHKSWSGLWISKLAIQRSGYGIDYRVVHRKVKVII